MKLAVVAALALLIGWTGPGFGQSTGPRIDPAKWTGMYQEAAECTRCHVQPRNQDKLDGALDLVLLTEYAIWKTHDKHAQAYAVLEERGKEMGKILKKEVTDPATGCMNCHAGGNLFTGQALDAAKLDGVSCAACHGPSAKWKDPHADVRDKEKKWRRLSREKKADLGFYDLRDPETRATVCASCHIGDATQGKVVTHEMFAAGHPPLPPIEFATFARNQPQHWRDSKDVPLFQPEGEALRKPQNEELRKNFDEFKKAYQLESREFQQTKLALVGSVVALRETMKLARDRADFITAEKPAWVWPELSNATNKGNAAKVRALASQRWPEIALAHSDCYSCHHDLKSPGFRQRRGFGYRLSQNEFFPVRPGRPLFRTWPLVLVEAGTRHTGVKERVAELNRGYEQLANACSGQPFGVPKDIGASAVALVECCDRAIADLRKALYTKESVRNLILDLTRSYSTDGSPDSGTHSLLPDYESARQIVSFLRVAYEECYGKAEAEQLLQPLAYQVNLYPYPRRPERLKVILDMVGGITGQKTGTADFVRHVENFRDDGLLDRLSENPFLTALDRVMTNDKFTKGLREPAMVATLQRYSNEELQLALQRVADFDPKVFQDNLRKFAQAVEAQK